jgi:hypothetical protein
MHLEPLSFSPRTDPISKKLLQPLPDAQSYTTLILNALLEKLQRWEGPSYHQLVGKWVEGGLSSAEDLRAWLRDIFSRGTVRQAQFDRATAQAEARHRHGIWVAVARVETVPMNSEHKCPQVLFGFGNPCWDRHWLSVFNSRKPKLVLPHDEWLSVLRSALPRIASEGLGFAGSLGTLTYDLASIYAHSIGSPHLLILSAAMEDILDAKVSPLLREGLSANLTLSCRTKAVSCPKSVCSTCRDRLLACFADFHLILEIRSKGNLLATMLKQQRAAPRFQKVYLSKNRNTNNQGNFELLQGFPDWTRA